MRRKEGLDLILTSGEFTRNQPAPSNAITIRQVINRLSKLPDQDKFLGIYIDNQDRIYYAIGIETDEHKEIL